MGARSAAFAADPRSKAVAGPLRYQEADEYTHIIRAGERFLCQLAQESSGEMRATARKLVRAYNAHDALLAVLKETTAEAIEVRRNIIEAKRANYEGVGHPKFENTYHNEMARLDAMIDGARASIALAERGA